MARVLRGVDFEVLGPGGEGYVNLNQRGMIAAIKEFGRRLLVNPGVGLFYFVGHGIEANDTNYLIPTDAAPDDETDLQYQALDLKTVFDRFDGNRLNVVILDACRDNPFGKGVTLARGGGKGLKRVDAPTGTFVAYATAPRRTASDGKSGNGLYTEQLLEAIRVPGLTLEQVFKRVRVRVQEKSGGSQVPWENSSLNGDFYFLAGESGGDIADRTPVQPDSPPTVKRERQFGTLVVTAPMAGIEILIDGKSQGISESKGEKFRVEGLTAGRTVEVRGRLKGRESAPKRIEVEPNQDVPVGLTFEWAKTFTDAAGIEFVLIPQGSFVMGSEQADNDRWKSYLTKYKQTLDLSQERPSRRVTLTHDFYLGKYEVTQRQWRYVAENLPKVKRDLAPAPSVFKGDDLPVDNVSWDDCEEFVLRLNQLGDGFEYALPTEAEWEYACRAGTAGDYAGELDAMGWYADNSGNARFDSYQAWTDSGFKGLKYHETTVKPNACRTHPVGQKQANAFGLYDMHGNVLEWCADWFDRQYYATGATADPKGPDTPRAYRVMRGGSWANNAHFCRSAHREGVSPDDRNFGVGVRVAIHSSRI